MASRSFFHRPVVLLILALCAVAAVVSLLGKLTGGADSAKKPIPLAAAHGAEAYPSFSPDGKRLAYSAHQNASEGFHLFIRDLPSGEERQLTGGNGSDIGPAWSPDGASIAFLRLEDEHAACMVVPAAARSNAPEDAEARRATVELFAPLEQRLVTDADSQKRATGLDVMARGREHLLFLEGIQAVVKRADAGKDDRPRVAQFGGLGDDPHVRADLEQRLLRAAQVARAVVNQCDHGAIKT